MAMNITPKIPSQLSNDPAVRLRFEKDCVLRGDPKYVYEAGDTQIISEILAFCNSTEMPVTFSGSQTSMTGASVAEDGVMINMAKRSAILDLEVDVDGNAMLVTEPGVILGDLKMFAAERGFNYPPDPTSYREALIGSTVATNATGSDSFKYGSTRKYVQELDLMCADGSLRTLKRNHVFQESRVKNSAGYFLGGEEIDEVIGSEGTLGLITCLKLKLLKRDFAGEFLIVLPFSSFTACIEAVTHITRLASVPVALELIGPGAAEYFKRCESCPEELKSAQSFLYLKDEYRDEADYQTKLERWFESLQRIYEDLNDSSSFEMVFVAKTDKQISDIQTCRHFIPLKVNEEYFAYTAAGGGKVGTDWWVPIPKLSEMMSWTFQQAQQLKLDFIVFAHIGNGHPHWNFLTKDSQQFQIAREFVKKQCEKAVSFGGGVAGEHGIGKIKHYLMSIQHDQTVLKKMAELKNKWDPKWILGRDNILKADHWRQSLK